MVAKSTAPNWLTIGQAAKHLGVSPDTLRRWEKKGKLKAYRTPGGSRRFTLYDLELAMRPQPKMASPAQKEAPKTQLISPPAPTHHIAAVNPPPPSPTPRELPQPQKQKSHPRLFSTRAIVLIIIAAGLSLAVTFSGLGKAIITRLRTGEDIIKPLPESTL